MEDSKEAKTPRIWMERTFTPQERREGVASEFEQAFREAFAATKGPRTMALFCRDTSDGCRTCYVTPEGMQHASHLLNGPGFRPIPRPSMIGLQLIVGHSEMTYYLPD